MAIIGIDLGTTNSLVAIWRDGKPVIINNTLGKPLTPSCVGIADDGQVLVGEAARDRLLTHPESTAAWFKRRMGSQETLFLNRRGYRPEELSALVLRSLKEDAEAFLGEPVEEAVISVPAYFNATQRKATETAGLLAGLRVERLINEPTAAALAYGLHEKPDEATFVVLDLGGGTFDVSVLEFFEGVMEVRASAGDNFLGGEDFRDALYQAFLTEQKLKHEELTAREQSLLYRQAEFCKCTLTNKDRGGMRLELRGQVHEQVFSRDEFEKLVEPLVARLQTPIERALRDSSLKARDFHHVILVGGATRMPVVRKMVAQLFHRLPTSTLSPDEVVAMGAAVQAALKERNKDLREVVLTDISPYTLGIEVSETTSDGGRTSGHYLPVIERNVIVPASRVKSVVSVEDNQNAIRISVYQGEARLVANNVFLGTFSVPIPKNKAGEESVEIRFTYDVNGLLEVEAKVLSTDHVETMVIEKSPGTLTSEEIQKCLKNLSTLKLHPRDERNNRAALAKGERLYEECLGPQRERIKELLSEFEEVLNRQDPIEAEHARLKLLKALEQFERFGLFE